MAIRNVFRACTIPHIREAPPKAETSSLKSMTLNKKSLPYLVSTNPISGLGIGHSHPVYIFPSIYLSIHLSIHLEIWRYRDTARERERARTSSSAKHTGNRLTTRKKRIWHSHVRLQVSIYPPLLTFDTWFQVAIGLVDTKARSQTFNVQNFRTSVFLNVLSFSKTWVHIISLLSIFIPY